MKHYFILSATLVCMGILRGQNSTDIRVLLANDDDAGLFCYDLQLAYHGEEAGLASQNYRIFYSAASLKLVQEKTTVFLPDDQYSFNIVQHNEGIDAKGIGDLSFEENLGFINATVLFLDPRSEGFLLNEESSWMSILQLCFEEVENMPDKEVLLAREELTAAYGRAFVELSAVDKTGAIYSLAVDQYIDSKE